MRAFPFPPSFPPPFSFAPSCPQPPSLGSDNPHPLSHGGFRILGLTFSPCMPRCCPSFPASLSQFNGCWTFCPDPVSFQSYTTVNIYNDTNAYFMSVDKWKRTPRPAIRVTANRYCFYCFTLDRVFETDGLKLMVPNVCPWCAGPNIHKRCTERPACVPPLPCFSRRDVPRVPDDDTKNASS